MLHPPIPAKAGAQAFLLLRRSRPGLSNRPKARKRPGSPLSRGWAVLSAGP